MPSWKGKTRGGLLGYRIFVATLKFFGLSVAYFILGFVAFYFYLFTPQSFKHTFQFYRKRLGFSSFSAFFKVYNNYYKFGQILLDKISLMSGFKNNFTFNFDGENYLHEIVTNNSGGLLIGAHVGNWEIAGFLLKRINTKINIVMYDEEHQKIKQLLESIYKESIVNIIPIKNDMSHIYTISNAFKNNEIICIHGDRFTEGSKNIEFDFLGEKALFPAGPFYLALKFNVPVTYVYAIKETNRHYHFYATKPKVYNFKGGLKNRNLLLNEMMQDYVNELETKVKKYPEHWFNFYDFWKN
ncbi:MAG: lipid A biosynthesis acyltransferase [Bacteroidetes bacterium GWA2_30_7]|nr:MAG: lipid A biosynthesis acyltransferase [Bacteroidetes bacterium GWA2_30_7]